METEEKETRWGILGTGNIAHQFAKGLDELPQAELVAVGSRAMRTAVAFAEEFDIPNKHARYEDLVQDPQVDAVYVATPHSLHKENTILCLEAGKPVLCEKPFAINAQEAKEVVAVARAQKVFLMEAMWTRFLPALVRVRRLLKDDVIGDPMSVNPEHRLFNPELGGGALLDVGVYTVSLASMLFGSPNRITSLANLGETGVDEQAGILLGYPGGGIACLYTAVRTSTPQEALIMGSKGWVRIHPPFWKAKHLTVHVDGEGDGEMELPYAGNGYQFEAEEVMKCLKEGKLESDIMPLDETVRIMGVLDRLRRQWGLRYPMET